MWQPDDVSSVIIWASSIPHTVGQSNGLPLIYNFKIRYFQRSQFVRAEIKVGVFCCRVGIALRSKGDISSVGQQHAVLLHGARDDLRRWCQMGHIVGVL